MFGIALLSIYLEAGCECDKVLVVKET